MYTVHGAPIATEAQEPGRARPSQRRAVKSADPDDVRACGSARIGALMQRPPPARRRAARNPPITAPADPAPARAEAGCMGEGGDGEDDAPPVRAEAGRTWERGGPTGWERVFVGILRICPHCQDWSTRSRVHRPPYAHMGAGDQPRRASENRGIMRKIDIHPGGALLSHVQPFCAAPQSDLRAAAAPSRTQRQTTTRPRKRSNAQFLGEMPGQPPDTSTRPPKSRGSLTMRGTAGSRLSLTATALATLLHPPFPIGDPPIPRRT